MKPGQEKVFLRDYKDRRGKVEHAKGTKAKVLKIDNYPLIEVQIYLDKGKSKIALIPESYFIEN